MPLDNTILNKKNYFNDVNSTIISLQVPMVCRSFTNVGRSGRTKSNTSIDLINKTMKGKKLPLRGGILWQSMLAGLMNVGDVRKFV